jgi:hypothetical protein
VEAIIRQTESAMLRVKSQKPTKSPVTTQTATLPILSLIVKANVCKTRKLRPPAHPAFCELRSRIEVVALYSARSSATWCVKAYCTFSPSMGQPELLQSS